MASHPDVLVGRSEQATSKHAKHRCVRGNALRSFRLLLFRVGIIEQSISSIYMLM
jgi:hypothetical protein